jgi:hypothetical protein
MHLVPCRLESRRRHQPGQPEQVRPSIDIQPQRMRDPVDHLGRGIPLPTLLQPRVVVRADNGQYGDFLAPQTRDAPITSCRQADGRGLHPGSMGTQEWGQLSS